MSSDDSISILKTFRILAALLFTITVTSFVIRWIVVEHYADPYGFSDFSSYYMAASALRVGQDPYSIDALIRQAKPINEGVMKTVPPFRQPVLYLVPFIPLTHVSYPHAKEAWELLVALSTLGVVWLLMKFFVPWRWNDPRALLLGSAALLFAPLVYSMQVYQINAILLGLLLLGFLSVRKKQFLLAAFLFALAIAAKPFLGAIVIVFLLQKKWRIAALTIGLACIVIALPFVAYPHTFSGYIHTTLPQLVSGNLSDNPLNPTPGAGSQAWFKNVSLVGASSRLFSNQKVLAPLFVAPILVQLARVVGILLFLYTLFILWKKRMWLQQAGESGVLFGAGLILIAWFLGSTFAWQHHLTFLLLLLPFVVLQRFSLHGRWAAVGIAGLVCTSVYVSNQAAWPLPLQQLLALLPTLGLVLLWLYFYRVFMAASDGNSVKLEERK